VECRVSAVFSCVYDCLIEFGEALIDARPCNVRFFESASYAAGWLSASAAKCDHRARQRIGHCKAARRIYTRGSTVECRVSAVFSCVYDCLIEFGEALIDARASPST
jgi:hypothetical protein